MDSKFNHSEHETKIYDLWEKSGAFTPKIDPNKKPYSIILPLPNANDPMHMGHALFTIEDILVRYHRMLGDPTLWLPGSDHAGIETQFVFEKKLQKEGKSRFDFDRETLYQMIWDFVEANRKINQHQMKKLGFSMDWTRYHYSMEPAIVNNVLTTFRKLYSDGLIYRDEKIVNYCTHCGTAFSNLEVVHKTVVGKLWFINYGPLSVATTRPETMLGDTAVAVHPSDKRYQKFIGTTLTLPLVGRQIPIIGDESIDPKFGTGAVKVTPSHSPEDYDMAKKHGLEFIRIFDYDGHANKNVDEKYFGLFPNQLRQAVLNDLGVLVEKTENHTHEVAHCYRCGNVIEPITAPQWFVKMAPLAAPAINAAKTEKVRFFPTRFKKSFIDWIEKIYDWPISRQIVWGPRIPVWYNLDENPTTIITFIDSQKKNVTGNWQTLSNQQSFSFKEIQGGLQSLIAPVKAKFYLSKSEASENSPNVLQETDTFDTWFLSGQWPLNTLGFNPENPAKSSPDFSYFYPTSVLDTLWDILFFWVARMIMFGLYLTKDVPFKTVHLHSRVVDKNGQKMSKSKGNVIDPLTITQQYGTDALRMSLVYGIAPASDFVVSEDKIKAQRNFANKIWNASRFILMTVDKYSALPPLSKGGGPQDRRDWNAEDRKIIDKLETLITSTTKKLESYRFGQASEDLYQFFWHDFCDLYIESTKNRGPEIIPILTQVLVTSLKLLHPFMPFVTEAVYQEIKKPLDLKEEMLITSPWPKI